MIDTPDNAAARLLSLMQMHAQAIGFTLVPTQLLEHLLFETRDMYWADYPSVVEDLQKLSTFTGISIPVPFDQHDPSTHLEAPDDWNP